MANLKSQKKRDRQNEKRRIRNTMVKSSIRTANKKVLKAIESSDKNKEKTLKELYKKFVKIIDTAAGKNIVKKNAAARKKSRLGKMVNKTLQNTGAASN